MEIKNFIDKNGWWFINEKLLTKKERHEIIELNKAGYMIFLRGKKDEKRS